MHHFKIQFGMDTDQQAICQKVKQLGGDCLQQSSGLVIKSPLSQKELSAELKSLSGQITLEAIDEKDEDISKDAQQFISNASL